MLVPGDQWSEAYNWRQYNNDFLLDDPASRIMYEAHQYFDADHTGTYKFGSLLCCNRLAGDQDLALENSRSDVSVRGRSRPAAKLLPR